MDRGELSSLTISQSSHPFLDVRTSRVSLVQNQPCYVSNPKGTRSTKETSRSEEWRKFLDESFE